MLGYFPEPYPDELFYSICARFSDRMQYSKRISVIQELFGAIVRSVADLPNHLETFINALPPGHHYTISQVIDKHTLVPFYGPFLPPERLSNIRAAMQQGNNGNAVQALIGNPHRNVHLLERLRFCPQCVIEDRQQFGECYWHRAHQVSCVKICPIHATLLQESDVRVIKRVYSWDFISAERGMQMESVRLDIAPLYLEILHRIACDVSWLLNQPNLIYGPDLLRAQYQAHLFNKGLASYTKKVNMKALAQFFSSYYPPDLLQLLHCELDLTTRGHWLITLIHNPHSAV